MKTLPDNQEMKGFVKIPVGQLWFFASLNFCIFVKSSRNHGNIKTGFK